jgi:hypothetical protein
VARHVMNTVWFASDESLLIQRRFTNIQGGPLESRVRIITECFEGPIATRTRKNAVFLDIHDRCAADMAPILTDILKCLRSPSPMRNSVDSMTTRGQIGSPSSPPIESLPSYDGLSLSGSDRRLSADGTAPCRRSNEKSETTFDAPGLPVGQNVSPEDDGRFLTPDRQGTEADLGIFPTRSADGR